MARPVKHDGRVFKRVASNIWWIEYRNQAGQRRRESTQTENWDEAQRKLRERLNARDDRTLEVARRGEQMSFQDWGTFFSGELLQASDPRSQDPRGQYEGARTSAAGLRQVAAG